MLCEIKYRLTTQETFNKSIENLYINRLKKCYESMDMEKQETLKVKLLYLNINNKYILIIYILYL